jgi:hypothetical protein
MFEPLNELGIPPNGLEKAMRRPIRNATSLGYYDFVDRLIKLGAMLASKQDLSNGVLYITPQPIVGP